MASLAYNQPRPCRRAQREPAQYSGQQKKPIQSVVVLAQKGMSGRVDSNHRPPAPEAGALSRTALRPDAVQSYNLQHFRQENKKKNKRTLTCSIRSLGPSEQTPGYRAAAAPGLLVRRTRCEWESVQSCSRDVPKPAKPQIQIEIHVC